MSSSNVRDRSFFYAVRGGGTCGIGGGHAKKWLLRKDHPKKMRGKWVGGRGGPVK